MTLASTTLSHALVRCLEALEDGETLEHCVDKYPQYRESLRPLLEVALALRATQPPGQPSPYFVIQLKEQLTRNQSQTAKGGEAR